MNKREVSKEEMRYRVPGVANRFLPVHKWILFVCIFLSLSIVFLTALVMRYSQVIVFNKKPVLLICSATFSEEDTQKIRNWKNTAYSEVILLRYDGYAVTPSEISKRKEKQIVKVDGISYDIGKYYEAIHTMPVPIEDCVCIVLRSDGKALYSYATYEDISRSKNEPIPISSLNEALALVG